MIPDKRLEELILDQKAAFLAGLPTDNFLDNECL
jgi:hypothetical protein